MMMIVVLMTTIELGALIVEDVIRARGIVLDSADILSLFSFFLLILIGLEVIETIKMYLDEHLVHVEVVFLVAMIAVARKVIVLDAGKYEPMTLIGVSALILSLSLGYYLIKKSHCGDAQPGPIAAHPDWSKSAAAVRSDILALGFHEFAQKGWWHSCPWAGRS